MAKYECCGMMYDDPQRLTSHMRKDHDTPNFAVTLACCETSFADASKLSDHMKDRHHIDMSVEV